MSEGSQEGKLPPQVEPEPGDVPSEKTSAAPAAGAPGHAEIVERINAILQSAEAAAAAIRHEATVKAEQHIQQAVADAEKQARATREAAEEMARQIEAAARQRQETLRAQTLPLETSMRRALDAFRGITAQLEELLGIEPGGESETIAEALSAPTRRDEREKTTRPAEQRGS